MSEINGRSKTKHDFDGPTRLPLIADIQRRSIESMSLEPRLCVLDVGCGTGASKLALGAAVGVAGVVHGVDYDAMMIAEARKRALLEGVDARVFLPSGEHHCATLTGWLLQCKPQ